MKDKDTAKLWMLLDKWDGKTINLTPSEREELTRLTEQWDREEAAQWAANPSY